MNIKGVTDLVPKEIKTKLINTSIEAISYFKKAYKLKFAFSAYLESSYERLSWMKTLLYRNEPIRLTECYVRNSVIFLDNDNHKYIIEDSQFLEFILMKKRVIVSGSAGVGKSVLCKSIFLEMVNKANGIYPIFIELRELNHHLQFSLLEYICSEISNIEHKVNTSNLEQLIKNGNILLILDGFDELDFDVRNEYTKQILELSKKYNKINILISSRPDENIKVWGQFYEVNIAQLDKVKAIELVRKLRYDEKLKTQFIKKIDEELYDSHDSFIGNPLLLTMMLMTFQEFADIPKKIYLFYEQAFQTLFLKHDSLKDLYIRKSHSGMDINEFKKALSYFCINTQLKNKITMTEEDAIATIKLALKHIGKNNINPNNVLIDLMSNLCLLHRDGLNITFSHRSFQEYFSALYIKDCSFSDKVYNLIDKIVLSNNSNICNIVYDMNPELLEKVWIHPKIELILSEISNNKITFQDKENRVMKVINGFLFFRRDKEHFIFYNSNSDIEGYNHIMFNITLWMLFHEQVNFSKENIDSMLNFNRKIKSQKLLNSLGEFIIDINKPLYLTQISEIKNKLNYNEYYYFIDYLHNDIFLQKKDHLIKIKDYIQSKKSNGERDIDKLLEI